jgi:hypothetical protein
LKRVKTATEIRPLCGEQQCRLGSKREQQAGNPLAVKTRPYKPSHYLIRYRTGCSSAVARELALIRIIKHATSSIGAQRMAGHLTFVIASTETN